MGLARRRHFSPALPAAHPAIGPAAFEVGPEVRDVFVGRDAQAAADFQRGSGDRWFADLYGLARRNLHTMGVSRVFGDKRCTHTEADTFFSFRRNGQCGRMATLIWLE